jgi:hypothetical protein
MKNIKKAILILIIMCSTLSCIEAQIKIISSPVIEGVITQERLFQFNLLNSYAKIAIKGHLIVELKEKGGQIVAQYESQTITLQPLETISGTAIEWVKEHYSGNLESSNHFKDVGVLSYGRYSICYSFDAINEPKQRFCTEINSELQTPPILTYPTDRSMIQTINPVLSWIPPLPITGIPYKYDMKLVELKQGQTCATALIQNSPIDKILQSDQYESNSYAVENTEGQSIEYDKTYCWQVGVYNKKQWIANTDIWQFSVNKPNSPEVIKPVKDDSPFTYLKQALDGETVTAKPYVKIVYDNRYSAPYLNYRVYSEGEENRVYINNEKIELQEGVNQVVIDCRKITNLKNNAPYVLEVIDDNNMRYYCRFTYEKTKKQ